MVVHKSSSIILLSDPFSSSLICGNRCGVPLMILIPCAYSVSHSLIPLTFIYLSGFCPDSSTFALGPSFMVVTLVDITVLEPLIAFPLPAILDPKAFVYPSALVEHHSSTMSQLLAIEIACLTSVYSITVPKDFGTLLFPSLAEAYFA